MISPDFPFPISTVIMRIGFSFRFDDNAAEVASCSSADVNAFSTLSTNAIKEDQGLVKFFNPKRRWGLKKMEMQSNDNNTRYNNFRNFNNLE